MVYGRKPKKPDPMKDLAKYVVHRLKKEGIVIMRYNSMSTRSIYLKVDFGVGYSIRISDHNGKSHLNYRYNLLGNIAEYRDEIVDEKLRRYFPFRDVEIMLAGIIALRKEQIEEYGMPGYKYLMDVTRLENKNRLGFWESAWIV